MSDSLDETICERIILPPADEAKKNNDYTMLVVIAGSGTDFGRHFVLKKERITIGRENGNDIVLHDGKVSKVHCVIAIVRSDGDIERIEIRDQGATNGTFVNGEPIAQATLMTGDKIQIGDTILQLSYSDEIEREYHARLFQLAARDSLTRLYNKRYTLNEVENHIRIARRNGRIFSIILIDIDDFKQVNDRYGHLAGDEYLAEIAGLLARSLREQDIAGRIGGEEFLLILPETASDGAFHLAVRIRKNVEAFVLNYGGHTIRTTISAGVCQFAENTRSVQEFLDLADKAMYEAKKAEKNKVMRACGSTMSGE